MTMFESRHDTPDTETMLRRVIEIVGNTRTLPLSSSVKLDNKDEVLELLEDACQRLPDELRQARWMMKEREEYLAKMQREGDDIIEAARIRAESVSRSRPGGELTDREADCAGACGGGSRLP